MSDVVHEDGGLDGLFLRVEDEDALLLERHDGLAHQVEGAEGMLEPCVTGTGIDHRGQSQLVDAVQALE